MRTQHIPILFYRKAAMAALLLAGLLLQPAHAEFINTDFSAGFSGWEAEVTEYNYNTFSDATVSGEIFASYPDNFAIDGTSVTLSTSMDQSSDYWSVLMYQTTQLASLASTQSLWVSLNVGTSLSDPLADFFFVQLRDMSNNDVLDLSQGGTFDLTAWAGKLVSFEFGVIDSDFFPEDSLTVSAIDFRLESVAVSEPSVVLLLAMGGLLLGLGRKKR